MGRDVGALGQGIKSVDGGACDEENADGGDEAEEMKLETEKEAEKETEKEAEKEADACSWQIASVDTRVAPSAPAPVVCSHGCSLACIYIYIYILYIYIYILIYI